MAEGLLPDIAEKVAIWFPDLGGRSLAVSEAAVTKENMPTLPLAMVALITTSPAAKWDTNGSKKTRQLIDDFVVDFWLASVKYRMDGGKESPFWAYYDYEAHRKVMLSQISGYEGPDGQRLEFVSMDIDSTQFAVTLSYRFKAHFNWCADYEPEEGDGLPAKFAPNLCSPKVAYCGPAFDQEDTAPCP